MLPSCFYLLAALGFVMYISFADMNLLSEPLKIKQGFITIYLRNLMVSDITLTPTAFNFTNDAINLTLEDEPMVIDGSIQGALFSTVLYTTYKAHITVSGSLFLAKNAGDSCTSTAVTTKSCTLVAKADIRGATTGIKFYSGNIDICSNAAALITSALEPAEKPLDALPAQASGTSSIKTSTFFNAMLFKASLGNLLGAKATVGFVANNAMHFHYGLLLPLYAEADTEKWSANLGARILGALTASLWNDVKSALDLPSIDDVMSGVLTTAAGSNVTVSMTTGESFFEDLVKNNASLKFETYVPSSAGLDFDLVVNDYTCKWFGLVCSIPEDRGIQVMNVRITGLGDVDPLFTNVAGDTVTELINRIITTVLTVKSVKSGDRRVLALF